jgi:hypothetical protein
MNRHAKGMDMRFSTWLVGAVLVFVVSAPAARAQGFGRARAGVAVAPRGAAATTYRGGAAVGPLGGVHAGAARTGTYVGPRGTTIEAGRLGGVGVGPFGGVHAAGAQGARVTTPAGRTYAAGERGAVLHGPYGGGAAVHGGFAYRPGGFAVGHATRYWSPAYLGTRASYVRSSFVHPVFTPVWYRAHPVAWVAPRWRVPNFWIAPAWASVALYCGITAPPIYYDYGGTTVIENNFVYFNGEEIASAEQYAAQAVALANAGRQANPGATEEWQPLGVFGLIQGDEQETQHIFQLAVDRAGIVRGNYYDTVVDNTVPVYGSVDPTTQRVAWSAGDKRTVVFETGFNNLTQDQTTVLVHYGTDRTVETGLVRLNEPAPGS